MTTKNDADATFKTEADFWWMRFFFRKIFLINDRIEKVGAFQVWGTDHGILFKFVNQT